MNLVFDWIMTHRWAMLPNVLRALAILVKAEATQTQGNMSVAQDDVAAAQKAVECLRLSIALNDGVPIDNTRTAELHGGVAVIPVVGPIYSRYSSWYSGTSIQVLAKDIAACMTNPAVKNILMNIHTPGGDVTGLSEVAEAIYQARKVKPVDAYIYGYGASGGYWLAAAARNIYAADTAEIGSIGVASVYVDYSEWDKKMGIKEIEVVSSQSPLKRMTPDTDKGKALLQTKVDDLANIFVTAVAKYRGVSTDKVLADFGQGDVMIASKALAAGMIDGIGSLESMIKDLNNKNPNPIMGGFMDIKDLQAQHPETYNAALEIGKTEANTAAQANLEAVKKAAADAERTRVAGILTLSKHPGADKLVAAAIADPAATKETVALQILDAQTKGTAAVAAAVAADSTDLAKQIQQVAQTSPDTSESAQEIELGKQIAATVN